MLSIPTHARETTVAASTRNDCDAGRQIQIPSLTLSMGYENTTNGKVTYSQLCTSDVNDLSKLPASEISDTSSGLVKVTAGLFQNHFKSCIPMLDQVTSFGFQSLESNGATSPVSFCLDNISLLPSSLQSGTTFPSRITGSTVPTTSQPVQEAPEPPVSVVLLPMVLLHCFAALHLLYCIYC